VVFERFQAQKPAICSRSLPNERKNRHGSPISRAVRRVGL
jgi:hypothetical protein